MTSTCRKIFTSCHSFGLNFVSSLLSFAKMMHACGKLFGIGSSAAKIISVLYLLSSVNRRYFQVFHPATTQKGQLKIFRK